MERRRGEHVSRVLPVQIDDALVLKAQAWQAESSRASPSPIDEQEEEQIPELPTDSSNQDVEVISWGHLRQLPRQAPALSPPPERPEVSHRAPLDVSDVVNDVLSPTARSGKYMPFTPSIPSGPTPGQSDEVIEPSQLSLSLNASLPNVPIPSDNQYPRALSTTSPLRSVSLDVTAEATSTRLTPPSNRHSPPKSSSGSFSPISSLGKSVLDRLHPVRPSCTSPQPVPSPMGTPSKKLSTPQASVQSPAKPNSPEPPSPENSRRITPASVDIKMTRQSSEDIGNKVPMAWTESIGGRRQTPPLSGPILQNGLPHPQLRLGQDSAASPMNQRMTPPPMGYLGPPPSPPVPYLYGTHTADSSPSPKGRAQCLTPPTLGSVAVNRQSHPSFANSFPDCQSPISNQASFCRQGSATMSPLTTPRKPGVVSPSLPVVINADFSFPVEHVEECIVNVGGVKFLVPTRLLKLDKDSNLQRMMDGEWEDFADDHPDGSFSIRRNPTLFPAVLEVLNGTYTFPLMGPWFLKALMAELDFYDLRKAKAELLQRYPGLGGDGQSSMWCGPAGLRLDGLYFAIFTPSLSALQHDEFKYATPDNVIRAFRFKVDGCVMRYKKHEKPTHVVLAFEDQGHYEALPNERISCAFSDGACIFYRDANGILVLDFKQKALKVVFHADDEIVSWVRLRFPT